MKKKIFKKSISYYASNIIFFLLMSSVISQILTFLFSKVNFILRDFFILVVTFIISYNFTKECVEESK